MAPYPPIELANEQPFHLGAVRVVPAACEILNAGRSQSLEPRIMQVLVVLAKAEGDVVSRGELIQRCWGGRIVDESAVNRVMSRIRQLAQTMGAESFRLETITKVGYRLTPIAELKRPSAQADVAPEAAAARFDRRHAIGGGVAALAVGGFAWMGTDRAPPPSDETSRNARLLYAKGKEAQGQLLLSQVKQSVAYLQEAVRLDPTYADAWGALAMSYANLAEFADDPEQEGIAQRLSSAAKRAREIDPDNADADVALILVTPHFRNWATVEQDCRRGLLRQPGHVRLQGKIPQVMCDTGRWREGAEGFSRLVRAAPYRTALHNQLALALWGAGRIEDAEQAIAHAVELWPDHPAVRATQFNFLALTGRPREASQMLAAASPSPAITPSSVAIRTRVARALETREQAEVDATAEGVVAAVRADVIGLVGAASYLAALGRTDAAFAVLADYYLGAQETPGGRRRPPTRLARRETDILFMPATASLRSAPRFASLTAEIGLDAYWKATKSVPDWRR